MDCIICGLGVIEEHYDFNAERWSDVQKDWIPGEIVLSKQDSLAYLIDPDNQSETLDIGPTGPQWYIKKTKMMRQALALTYKKYEVEIKKLEASARTFVNDESEENPRGTGTFDEAVDRENPQDSDILEVWEQWYLKQTDANIVYRIHKDTGHHELARWQRADTAKVKASHPDAEGVEERKPIHSGWVDTLNKESAGTPYEFEL